MFGECLQRRVEKRGAEGRFRSCVHWEKHDRQEWKREYYHDEGFGALRRSFGIHKIRV